MFIQANGITLGFDTFGDPSKPVLLLISGLNTPMTRWTATFCQKLADAGHYVIRYDNRDCGISEHLDDCESHSSLELLIGRLIGYPIKTRYELMDMVRDAVGLLDALNIESAHIVGRSMGGMIGQLLAAKFPDRVRTLTVIMSSTGNRKLPLPKWNVLKHMLRKHPNPQNNLAAYLKHRVAYTKAIGSKKYPLDDFYIRSRVMDDIKRSGFNPGAAKRQLAAFLNAGDIRQSTKSIKAPALVIHGDMDDLTPIECGVDVYKNIPKARLYVVREMGHSLQPEFFDEIIREIKVTILHTTHDISAQTSMAS